jgi:hypothetical protein
MKSNEVAIAADEDYITQCRAQGLSVTSGRRVDSPASAMAPDSDDLHMALCLLQSLPPLNGEPIEVGERRRADERRQLVHFGSVSSVPPFLRTRGRL